MSDRLELFSDLACNGGERLAEAGFVDVFDFRSVKSKIGPESLSFSFSREEEAAAVIRENLVARVWRSDAEWEEWTVGAFTIKSGFGATVDVTCDPIIQRLATCGLVEEWQTTPLDGRPQLTVGVAGLSARDILQTYLVDNPQIRAQLPWLRIGQVDPEVLLSVSWSWRPPLGVANAVLDALAAVDEVCDVTLTRNGVASYDLNIITNPVLS